MRARSIAAFLPLAALGCSANVVGSSDVADAESASAVAVIVVERTSGHSERGEAVARFVRGRAGPLDDQALRWLGVEIDLPVVGTCARIAAAVPTIPAGGVRLLDVGKVTLAVDTPGHEPVFTDLIGRRVPDVDDVVSGLVYTTSALDLPPIAATSVFEAKVSGEPELEALGVQIDFPGEPALVRVRAEEVPPGSVASLARGEPVEITWESAGDRDVVYVDVSAAPEGGDLRQKPVIRCAFGDTGRAVLPASAFGDAEGTLSVRRLHRAAFRGPGVDRGELRLDFGREIAFAVQPRN